MCDMFFKHNIIGILKKLSLYLKKNEQIKKESKNDLCYIPKIV